MQTVKLRNTLILLAVLVVLLGYAYYSSTRSAAPLAVSGTPSPTPVAVLNFLTDNVNRFQVTDLQKNQSVVVARQGQGWHMEQPKDSAADPFRIADALGSIAHLEATRALTSTGDLTAYGLVTGTLEARVTMSDTTQYVLKFGDDTVDKTGIYMLKDGEQTVYVISASIAQTLRDYVANPPYPPTPTPTPLPSLAPSVTPTPGPTGAAGTPSPAPSPGP